MSTDRKFRNTKGVKSKSLAGGLMLVVGGGGGYTHVVVVQSYNSLWTDAVLCINCMYSRNG